MAHDPMVHSGTYIHAAGTTTVRAVSIASKEDPALRPIRPATAAALLAAAALTGCAAAPVATTPAPAAAAAPSYELLGKKNATTTAPRYEIRGGGWLPTKIVSFGYEAHDAKVVGDADRGNITVQNTDHRYKGRIAAIDVIAGADGGEAYITGTLTDGRAFWAWVEDGGEPIEDHFAFTLTAPAFVADGTSWSDFDWSTIDDAGAADTYFGNLEGGDIQIKP